MLLLLFRFCFIIYYFKKIIKKKLIYKRVIKFLVFFIIVDIVLTMGAIAQLGERFAGSEEVVGSIPSSSTKKSQWIQTDSLTI